MKVNFNSSKWLFFLPLFFVIAYYLIVYNYNFSINGAQYEFFFSEAIITMLEYIVIEIVIYFILLRFIKNKYFITIIQLLFIFFLSGGIYYRVFFFLCLLGALIYRKDNDKVKFAFESILTVISFMTIMLFAYNSCVAVYQNISFKLRDNHYREKVDIKVDDNTKSPNIYWIHMDGMPNLDFIRKYYKSDVDTYQNSLEEKGFIVNSSASFDGAHRTIVALNALYNPNYYDNFLKDYLDDFKKCDVKKCKTKNSLSYKDATYIRFDNELFSGFKKKGYNTIEIGEFNHYTSFNADYVYDIWNIENDHKIKYFKNTYSKDEIYKYILKVHRNPFTYEKFNNTLAEKEISLDYSLSYPYLNNTKSYSIRGIMKSLEGVDVDNPKLYFIDNTLIHLRWEYDSDGNFTIKNNNRLKDFDETYIYTLKIIDEMTSYLMDNDPNSIIVIQADHGIHSLSDEIVKNYYKVNDKELLDIRNSTFSAIYIPDEYKNGNESYLNNPLNISRYLINNYVGENYEYLK